MSEWKSCRLSDLVSFQKGRKVEVSQYRRDGFAPYLGAGVLAGGVATEYADNRFAVLADSDDVLMLWDGERSGLVGKGRPGVVSSTVAKLSPKAGIDTTFLYYALDIKFDWIQGRRTGTGVPHVPKDLGRILRIHHPTKQTEQRRIAEILSTVDEAIEQTEALIAKTQAIKAGLMHDLFTRGVTKDGQLRPPREEAPQLYKQSPLGWIPREWETIPLDKSDIDIIDGDRGVHYPKAHELLTEGHCLFLSATNVTRDGFRFDSTQFISEAKHQLLGTGSLLRGDIVITTRGTVGNIAYYDESVPFPVVRINSGMIILRSAQQRLSTAFLYYSLKNYIFVREYMRVVSGSAQPQLPIRDLQHFNLLAPPLDEQERLIRCVLTVDDRLSSERQTAAKLRSIKRGLMNDLLTGKVQVNIPSERSKAS